MGGASSSPKKGNGDAYREAATDTAESEGPEKGKSDGGANGVRRSTSSTAIQARPKVFSERVDTTRLSFRDESPDSPKVSQIGQDLLVSVLKNFFYMTSSEQMAKSLMKDLTRVVVVRGDVLMTQGENGDKMYLLERGLLDVLRNDQKVDSILPGHVVGELALLFDEPRTATIVASAQESVLWSLDRTTFQTIQAANALQSRSRAANFIKDTGVLDKLRLYTLRRLAAAMTRKELAAGEVLLTAGEATDACYLLESGTLAVPSGAAGCPAGLLAGEDAQGTPIAKTGCFLGQMILLGAAGLPGGEAYDAAAQTCTSSLSVEAVDACRISYFSLSTFRELIGPVEAALKGGHEEHFGKGARMSNHLVAGLSWDDFTVEGLLGEGAFGAVVLATCNKSSEDSMAGKLFGVKILSKANVARGNHVRAVWNERDCLNTFKHPLVIGLDATFQTADNLFLVTPYVTACSMFEVLYSIDPDTQDPIGLPDSNRSAAARAWMAQVLEGLSHIHHQGCAYRDIKPENLLIDKDGRVIIIDLGFTKRIPYSTLDDDGVETEHDESYTLCGTYEYLAPEFFLGGCGHNHAVDYWAMGVLLFEVLYGRTPFVDQPGESDLKIIFKRICSTKFKPYKFPLNFDDKAHIPKLAEQIPRNACRSMVAKLLEPVASKRLGNLAGGAMDIKNHPYFAGTDWEGLANPAKVHPDTVKPPDKLLGQTLGTAQDALLILSSSIVDGQSYNGPQNPFYGW